MFESVNRNALILFPKQALNDWANKVYPDYKSECPKLLGHDQGNVYLIPEFYNTDEGIEFLKLNYKVFFERELEDWSFDQNTWPKKLTWKLFEEWFHYSIQSMVTDTMNENIRKETI